MAIKELKFLLKHSSIYGLGTFFAQAAGFLLLPFYTSYLTPKDYGIAALVETTISIVALMATMGISQAIARFYSEKDDEREKSLVISTTYIITWAVCIVCIPVLSFLSVPFSKMLFQTADYGIFFMLSSISLFIGFNMDIGLSYLNLRQKSLPYVALSLANLIMLISLNVYFIAFIKIGLIGIFYSALITKSFFAFFMSLPIILKVKLRFSLSVAARMIRFSIPLGLSDIFRVMTNESDKFIINHFFSPVETGIYAIAGKLAFGVHILITTTFIRSYQPIRFELAKGPNGARIYGIIFEQYLLAIGSFGLIIAMFSNEIIRVMTTKDFYSAALYIPPLILTWVFFGMKIHLENGILISMKTKYLSYITGFACLANVGLNFLLIPFLGLWGAVLSTNLSNIILVGLSFVISQKLYRINIEWDRVIRLILCISVIFSLSILASRLDLLRAFLVKSFLLLAYGVSIFIFRIIEPGIFLSFKKLPIPSDEGTIQ